MTANPPSTWAHHPLDQRDQCFGMAPFHAHRLFGIGARRAPRSATQAETAGKAVSMARIFICETVTVLRSPINSLRGGRPERPSDSGRVSSTRRHAMTDFCVRPGASGRPSPPIVAMLADDRWGAGIARSRRCRSTYATSRRSPEIEASQDSDAGGGRGCRSHRGNAATDLHPQFLASGLAVRSDRGACGSRRTAGDRASGGS